jgi:AcrR family transcriptional regulator
MDLCYRISSRRYWTRSGICPETEGKPDLRDATASSKQSHRDRRVRRSRAALTAALSELTLERGYQRLQPAEVAQRADVGRSTLYTHFAGLDDLLAHSLDGHLTSLAECSLKPNLDPALLAVIEHFWAQRRIARPILKGEARWAISRLLVTRLEAALAEFCRLRKGPNSESSVRLIATQIAAGQLAMLDAWLSGRAAASPDQVARLLHASAYAGALASL